MRFSVGEAQTGSFRSVEVEGAVGVHGASVVGRTLLATLNGGGYRLLLDLSRAEPVAACALLGTLLRIDRYAASRGARLVVLAGEAMEPVLGLGNSRGLLTIANTREQAEALLAGAGAVPAPNGQRPGAAA
jgi:hypothetical protein